MTPDNRKPETIDQWLEQLGQPAADRDYKPGHERMHDLLAPLAETNQLKQPKLRIRIAGTNGKGSTAFMLANALQACGLKVGLYTSPHILQFNERIRINGEPVSDTALLQGIEQLMPRALEIGASYFETATALALKQFSDLEVDVEILEAGVGARLDATTAVEADVALITPIGLDHQGWLGDTLEQVAMEKAYAMQDCNIAISAPQHGEAEAILFDFSPKMHLADVEPWPNLSLPGEHQHINASLAMSAVRAMSDQGLLTCPPERAKAAIEATAIPGRLQKVIYDKSTLWLDAAHNSHAVEALLPTIKEMGLDTVFVFTREDRDLRECIPMLKKCAERVVGADSSVFDAGYESISEALSNELGEHPSGNYLVLGSFLTVAASLNWINRV